MLHKHLWPLPPDGVVLLEPEPEPEGVWRLDAEPAPRTPALATSISATPAKVTEQVWPLLPRDQPVRDFGDVSNIFDPDAAPGSIGALPGSRGAGSRTYDTWLDHSSSAIFLNELLGSPGGRHIDGPARAQTPDLGPPRMSTLSTLQRVERQRPSSNKPRATQQGDRPWTSERFENLSAGRGVREVGTTTGSLQMSVPLENELRRTAMDYVSRMTVRRKAAARKRLGSQHKQSTAPQAGVAFGSTVRGSMRWTVQRSSNSQCSVASLASSSQVSIGSRSPRRATTPDGGLAGQSGRLPGPSAGWFLPLSPHHDDENSPREIRTKRPVLIQASEPQLSGRTGRQSPRHGASVRYVKSPGEKQQGSGRDPSRSHLFGKGVGEVLRYRVLDKVIEVHAEPAPETPALPPAAGISIQAIQTRVTQPPSVGRSGLDTEQATDTPTLSSESQRQSRTRIAVTTAATTAHAKGTQPPPRRLKRRHLGQRPLPGQFAPGAVILDDFRSMGKRPVMVQLAQQKQK